MLRNHIDDILARRRLEMQREEQNWRERCHLYLPVLEKLDAVLDVETITLNPNATYLYLSFHGDKELFTKVIRALRTTGWRTMDPMPDANQPSWSSDFHLFRYPEGSPDGEEVSGVEIFLSFSSTVCRRVKIGTKMQEVDIYETVCSDDPESSEGPY